MNIALEVFKLTDLDEVLILFRDTVHTVNKKDYSQEQIEAWAPATLDRDRWAKKLTSSICYVARIGNKVVGFGDATSCGIIDHIYTHKDFQGQGIASTILNKLEEELLELGVSTVRTEASITAKPFFERRGYVVVSSQNKKHRSGIIFRNYLMHKNYDY